MDAKTISNIELIDEHITGKPYRDLTHQVLRFVHLRIFGEHINDGCGGCYADAHQRILRYKRANLETEQNNIARGKNNNNA